MSERGEPNDGAGPVEVARALHRTSRGYVVPAPVVPLFGIATAGQTGVLDEGVTVGFDDRAF